MMAARRAASIASRCSGCRSHVLSSFISSLHPTVGTNDLISVLPPHPPKRSLGYQQQPRNLSTTRNFTDAIEQIQDEQEILEEELKPAEEEQKSLGEAQKTLGEELKPLAEEQEALSRDDLPPWYLQLQEAEPEASNPFAVRQQLPDLPPNAPPILEPMLKHISVDLGLDYVSILDLRPLDPPPALGSGTIMIFGSVRSFKHLNVSADRLCRWLRTNYKLTPNADGLLGRNELKLKMRRRARRSKMLGAAGVRETPDFDDGITTNWICVDVGEVEDGPDVKHARGAQNKGFVGFGRETNTAKVVVQMMTEEKRTEMDLEGMWQALVEREERKKEGERRAWAKLEEAAVARQVERGGAAAAIETSATSPIASQVSSTSLERSSAQQVRSLHTSARRRNADESRDIPSEDINHKAMEALLEPLRSKGIRVSKPRFSTLMPELDINDNSSTSNVMRSRLNWLQMQEPVEAILQLGHGQDDYTSTDFLRQFHGAWPPFPNTEHFLCMIDLQCYALLLGHEGYLRLRLMKIFRDMQGASIWIPKKAFVMGLEAVLLSNHPFDDSVTSETATELDRLNALRRSLGFAFELIERMESHGYDVRTEEIFVLLLDAICNPPTDTAVSIDVAAPTKLPRFFLDKYNTEKLQHKFRRALDLLYRPTTESDDPIYLALIEICILTEQWNQLWEAWQHVARMGRSRGPKMYASLFKGVAKSQDQAKCQRALMTNVPEMAKEQPRVQMEGEVAWAVLECLVSAQINEDDGQWREIAASCRAGLHLKQE